MLALERGHADCALALLPHATEIDAACDVEGSVDTAEVFLALFLGVFHDVCRILLIVQLLLARQIGQTQDARCLHIERRRAGFGGQDRTAIARCRLV